MHARTSAATASASPIVRCTNAAAQHALNPADPVPTFANEREAVALANSTRYGLSASLWTQDLSRAHRVAEQLECGTVWINCWLLRDLRVRGGTGLRASDSELMA
jgi:acyl-CoA reductase-like NAD-dependent aldehyde dehydrogenase